MLTQGFLRSRNKLQLTRKELAIAILIWFGYSTTLYFFLIYTKEIIRWSAFTLEGDIYLPLSTGEHFFFGSFLAWISGLIGMGATVNHLVTRRTVYSGRKRNQLMTDANGLLWYSFRWFAKMATFYGFIGVYIGVFDYYQFIDYWPVFVLAALFFFLYQTQNWRLYLGSFVKQLRLGCFVGLICFSVFMAFSSASISAQQDFIFKQASPSLALKIQLPNVDYSSKLYRRSQTIDVFVGYNDSDSIAIRVKRVGMNYSHEQLVDHLFGVIIRVDELGKQYLPLTDDFIINLKADKNVLTGYIKKLLQTIRSTPGAWEGDVPLRKIFMSTSQDQGIMIILSFPCPKDSIEYPIDCQELWTLQKEKGAVVIRVRQDSIYFHDELVVGNLHERIRAHIEQFPKSNFQIIVDDQSKYETMVLVHAAIQQNALKARDELSRRLFTIPYETDLYSPQTEEWRVVRDSIRVGYVQWIGDEVTFDKKVHQ